MPTDDLRLRASELEKDYQILTELHRTETSRTYLARHLELNRDVTVTIVQTHDPANAERVAADARLLSSIRHPNVIPVVEGRPLGDDTFAVVHARVRGSTLDQTLSAVGAMPLPRVAATLQQLNDAITWARANGVAHRSVFLEDVVFQQGSGRALVALDTAAVESQGASDACADARTIGSLAWAMLAGRPDDGVTPLFTLRPDLPTSILERLDALQQCGTAAEIPDIAGLIALLAAASPEDVVTPAVSTTIIDSGPAVSSRESGPAVVPVKRPFGFGARMAAAVSVIVIVGVLGLLLLRNRPGRQSLARGTRADSNEVAGEVDSEPRQLDTTVMSPTTPVPATIDSQNTTRPPASGGIPGAIAPTVPPSPIAPPVPRHEPPLTPPRVRMPLPSDTTTGNASRDSVGQPDVCASPAVADQRACLGTAIARNDAPLNDVYQQLILALRRQAGVADTATNPVSVEQLRAAQRDWLDRRDQTCRTVGQRPLYARDRAQCFADQTAQRTRELQQQLAALP